MRERERGDAQSTAEVSGQHLQAVAESASHVSAATEQAVRDAFARTDLPATPTPDTWHPQTQYLDATAALDAALDAETLGRLGAAYPAVAPLESTDGVASAMASLVEWYRETHRGEAGRLTFESTGERTGRLTCETPYPCVFELGAVTALSQRAGTGLVTVTEVGHCRRDGAEACTYRLSW